MKSVRALLLATVLVIGASVLAGSVPADAQGLVDSGVVSEDVSYWYMDNDTVQTIFNPSTQWLDEWIPTGAVLLKVQQTVYDEVYCAALLGLQGEADPNNPGYLYAYSVTNINWGNPFYSGLSRFEVYWDIEPLLVTTSARQTPAGWQADDSAGYPAWDWTLLPNTPGLLPGETVGGLWAVAPAGPDDVVDAGAQMVIGDCIVPIMGQTTGPVVPAPASVVTLLTGLAGLGAMRIRKRK